MSAGSKFDVDVFGPLFDKVGPFLDSDHVDALLTMVYLGLFTHAIRLVQRRLFPGANLLRAAYFLCTWSCFTPLSDAAAQFAIFYLRTQAEAGNLTREQVGQAVRILWAFRQVDLLAQALLWRHS